MSWILGNRGRSVIELDGRGRVVPGQPVGETDPTFPLRVRNRHLVGADTATQHLVDRAIWAATAPTPGVGVAHLTGLDGRAYLLQVHPVPGALRDVFLSAAALAVLIELHQSVRTDPVDLSALRCAFDLTSREADVAGLVARGLDLKSIAARLGIGRETVRSYLKGAFDKTGTSRQAELASLLSQITP